jgi:signal transduction histidine kinase
MPDVSRAHSPWRPPSQLRGPLPDAVVAVAVFGGVAAWGRGGLDPLGWSFAAASSAALCLRSRFPIGVACFTLLLCLLYYPISAADGPIWPALLIALYSVAAEAQLLIAIILVTVALIAFAYDGRGTGTPQLASAAPFLLAGWLVAAVAIGGVVRNRQAFLREAGQHAVDIRRRRAEELRLRAAEERLRIARELHDVLGHNISLVNVQASAALHRLEAHPEGAAPALVIIKDASKEALSELRGTLGVLRQVDEDTPTAPTSGPGQLSELVARANTPTRTVALDASDLVSRRLPPATSLAVLRIVQESLTNVARHSGATEVAVRISVADGAVRLRIDDNGTSATEPAPGSGSGLQGMSERARVCGGTFTATHKPDGGFRVEATLPLSAPIEEGNRSR